MVNNKSDLVKEFFNDTPAYLKNNVIITLRKEIVNELIGTINNQKIIDIGCGNGAITAGFIRNNYITFVDLSKKMLMEVEKSIPSYYRQNATLINKDIETLDISEKFDIVVCLGVLAHVPDINILMSKLADLINPNGKICLQFTDSSSFISKFILIKNKITGIIKKKTSYNVNKTPFPLVKMAVLRNRLKIVKKVTYFPVLPLMSFIPFKLRYNLLFRMYNNKIISGFGSEVVLLLESDPLK